MSASIEFLTLDEAVLVVVVHDGDVITYEMTHEEFAQLERACKEHEDESQRDTI